MPSIYEIDLAAREAQVRLTGNAKSLIKLVLDSVTEDPHRSWRSTSGRKVTTEKLLSTSNQLSADLPETLRRIKQSLGVNELSTFDVLHWLTENLDSICPMIKLPNE